MLSVAIHQGVSFPVGKVEFLTLTTLNFHEYLLAMNDEPLLNALLARNYSLLQLFTDKLMQHMRQYCFLGGMPEVIMNFAVDRDFFRARETQQAIILAYENDFFEEFKGVIAEQFICQQIKSQSISCFYWSPEGGTSEVDFIIQHQDEVVPIEVKSGLNLRSRSLRVYYDKYNPKTCIRTSPNACEEQSWMTNIPLFSFLSWLKTPPPQTATAQNATPDWG